MLEQLLLHIERHQLCKTTDKILLAVSGGVDSMAMIHLFAEAGFSFGVVHCNFQLRGDDSYADEALVKKVCNDQKIDFHVTRFDTAAFAQRFGLSIQLAARKLRYDYFETVRAEFNYDCIATAHHLNDSIETVLINLTRGTGVSGLTGIPVKNSFIIRPLLFAARDQIIEYAGNHKLEWREDLSNREDDYQRNFLRHHVIPRLKEINPNLEQTFAKTIERFSGAVAMTEKFLSDFKATSCEVTDMRMVINLNDLRQNQLPQVMLWELLKPNGFNYDQCVDVLQATQSGKEFFSSTHRLTIDRHSLLLTARFPQEIAEVLIREDEHQSTNGYHLLQIEKKNGRAEIDPSTTTAILDASKITFPLRWRKWTYGDSFLPLGMSARKKISDFLIDLKIPNPDKENITVLESEGRIAWVVGMRISDEFKITPSTTASISFKLQKLDPEKIS